MGYKSKHFRLEEWVHPETFKKFGEKCWMFLSVKMLVTADEFREEFGPMFVNNWHDGGRLKECGLRDINCSQGAPFSIHKLGGAGDFHPIDVTPQEMYERIKAKPERFQFLTCLENIKFTEGWLHADVRNHDKGQQLWIVDPV